MTLAEMERKLKKQQESLNLMDSMIAILSRRLDKLEAAPPRQEIHYHTHQAPAAPVVLPNPSPVWQPHWPVITCGPDCDQVRYGTLKASSNHFDRHFEATPPTGRVPE